METVCNLISIFLFFLNPSSSSVLYPHPFFLSLHLLFLFVSDCLPTRPSSADASWWCKPVNHHSSRQELLMKISDYNLFLFYIHWFSFLLRFWVTEKGCCPSPTWPSCWPAWRTLQPCRSSWGRTTLGREVRHHRHHHHHTCSVETSRLFNHLLQVNVPLVEINQ